MFYFDLFSQGYVACFNKLLKINDKRLNTNSNFYTQITDWKRWNVTKIRVIYSFDQFEGIPTLSFY